MDAAERLLEDLSIPGVVATPAKPTVRKVSYTHDAMIDLIIANPAISQNQLAAHFGYTASWISIVRNSDAFKARLAARKAELIDPVILASAEQNFEGILARSIEVIKSKLDKDPSEIPDQLALRTMELSAKALGYGAGPQSQVNVQVNVDTHLEKLGDNLTKLLARRKEQAAEAPLPVPMEDEGNDA